MDNENILNILNVRKGNFSWDVEFDKAKHSTSGSMKFNGAINFEIKKFDGDLDSKEIIFGNCNISIVIDDMATEEKLGQFNVNYHIDIEPSEKLLSDLESNNKKKENEVKRFMIYIIEPYFRYDFEKVMYDAELPKSIIPYGLLENYSW